MEFINEFVDNIKYPFVCGKVSQIIEYMANCHSKGLIIEEKVTDLDSEKVYAHNNLIIICNVPSPLHY